MVEFGLCFVLFITFVVAAFEFSWVLFVKATFHHAVREGVRAAITGQAGGGYANNHDGYVKSVIKANSVGLLDDDALDAHVQIDYLEPNGACGQPLCPAVDAAAGNIVQVSIQCYEIFPVTSMFRGRDAEGNTRPITISVSSADRMEPFPGGALQRGTQATATACLPPGG